MPIAGNNRISFKAQIVDGRLTMDRNELTMVSCMDPVDAIEMLLDGVPVRVNGNGNARQTLMALWEQQAGGATE